MKKIILMLLIISGSTLQAQTPLYFNFESRKLTLDTAGNNEVTTLDRTQKYVINVIHFNPFQYSATAKITATDNVKGIFEIFNGLFLKGELPAAPAPAAGLAMNAAAFLNIRNQYIADYEKSVRLSNLVFSEDFDCSNIPAAMIPTSNQLLNSYFDYIKQPPALKDADKLPAQIPADEATIVKMNRFNNKVVYFVNTLMCQVELVRFEPEGTSINLKINFVARDANSGLENIDYSNNLTVKSKIKVTFSSGIFVSTNLKKQYYIDDSLANNYILKEESKGNLLPGVIALAHLNLSDVPNFGLNMGAGIDIDKTPHVLVGLSYKLANTNILLDSGLDLAYLERLTDKYTTDTNYITKPEVSYRKEFVGGFWFGVTYKL